MSLDEVPHGAALEREAAPVAAMLAGRYRLVRRIGCGASGQVFEGCDTALDNEPVAIKLAPVAERGASNGEGRLHREGRILFSLSHPHIIQPRALGEAAYGDGGEPIEYLVLELLRGEPLSARLTRGPLTNGETRRYLGQLAEALEYLHGAGYVHGDLKPSNLFLTSAGDLKVLDFGVTHLLPEHGSMNSRSAVGTLYYLAPELQQGGRHSTASDIYALGLIGLEMAGVVAGPHGTAPTPAAVRAALAKPCPDLSDDVRAVLAAAVARLPAKRIRSAAAVRQSLDPCRAPRRGTRLRSMVFRFTRLTSADVTHPAALAVAAVLLVWTQWNRPAGWGLLNLDNVHGATHVNALFGEQIIPREKIAPYDLSKDRCQLNDFIMSGDYYGAVTLLRTGARLCKDSLPEALAQAVERGNASLVGMLLARAQLGPQELMNQLPGKAFAAGNLATYRLLRQHTLETICEEQLNQVALACDTGRLLELFRAGGTLNDRVVACAKPPRNPLSMTAIFALRGCTEIAEIAYRSPGGHPSAQAGAGQTTLPMYLASLGEWGRLKDALDYGAIPWELQPDGDSLLKIAIESHGTNLEIVGELARYPGVDLGYRTPHGLGYLSVAVHANSIDGLIPLIALLSPDEPNPLDGRTALHYAVDHRLRIDSSATRRLTFDSPIMDDELRSVTLMIPLLAAGASPDRQDGTGVTVRREAETAGCRLCIALLAPRSPSAGGAP